MSVQLMARIADLKARHATAVADRDSTPVSDLKAYAPKADLVTKLYLELQDEEDAQRRLDRFYGSY